MASASNLVAFLPSSLARGRRRDIAARIVERAAELEHDDRALLIAVYAEGRTVQAFARRQDPDPETLRIRAAALRRRARRLTQRLLDPAFELVRTRACAWSPTLARVGRARFIRGLSIRETAAELRLSLHTVRNLTQAIRTMAASPRGAAPEAPSDPTLFPAAPAALREAAA